MAQQIAVQDLDLPQLADVRKQLEEEITHFTSSYAKLSQAMAKFKNCLENVADVESGSKDNSILIPLTNSLYVPGKLSNTKTVIVDVGTGYYVEKTTKEASKHYDSKISYVQSNINGLQEVIQRKQDNLSVIMNVMQAKLQQQGERAPS